MYKASPLFSGNSTLNQLSLIIVFLGTPNEEEIESFGSPFALQILEEFPKTVPRKKELISFVDDDISDLVSNLIIFNHKKRLSAFDALNHVSLKDFNQNIQNSRKIQENKDYNFIPPFLLIESILTHPFLFKKSWNSNIFKFLKKDTQISIESILICRKVYNQINQFPLPKFVIYLIFYFLVSSEDFKLIDYDLSLLEEMFQKKKSKKIFVWKLKK